MKNESEKFVSLNYELCDSKTEEHMLKVFVFENEIEVKITCATMCVYFEEEILKMAKKIWHNKEIKLVYRSGIELRYYTYLEFMKHLKDLKSY